MKLLNGKDVADFIKLRQLHVSRSLHQGSGVTPKLVIIRSNPDPIVDIYMKLKKKYGEDIEVEVEVIEVSENEAVQAIQKINNDETVHGIIVQLPLANGDKTDEIINSVDPAKDVDGLHKNTPFPQTTPMAIGWLLAAYNIELQGKKIAVVGQGRLVGASLTKQWQASGNNVLAVDENTKDLNSALEDADIIVSATGQPGLIKSKMVKEGAVVVDAGVASGSNGLVGDVSEEVRSREDITITPEKGGVGPLTIAAIFENLLLAVGKSTSDM